MGFVRWVAALGTPGLLCPEGGPDPASPAAPRQQGTQDFLFPADLRGESAVFCGSQQGLSSSPSPSSGTRLHWSSPFNFCNLLYFILVFETVSHHVAQVGLELRVLWPWPLSAQITGVHHCTWLLNRLSLLGQRGSQFPFFGVPLWWSGLCRKAQLVWGRS
jgi:hypothetical protein